MERTLDVEFRLTVTIARHGHDLANGDRFLRGFTVTHPEVGAVADQNTQTGELSVTFSFDADGFTDAAQIGARIFQDGAKASGLEPTELVDACFSVVTPERDEEDVRELQPA